MFEKEAEEIVKRNVCGDCNKCQSHGYIGCDIYRYSKDSCLYGLRTGYNKANEWHDLIADPNDLPKEEHKSPSECKNYYVVWFGKNNFSGAKFINGKFCDGDFVYYPDEIVKWKEIILPELPKESE